MFAASSAIPCARRTPPGFWATSSLNASSVARQSRKSSASLSPIVMWANCPGPGVSLYITPLLSADREGRVSYRPRARSSRRRAQQPLEPRARCGARDDVSLHLVEPDRLLEGRDGLLVACEENQRLREIDERVGLQV